MEFQMIGLNPVSLIIISVLSINSYDSGLAAINCGILWGSVLEPLLFLLYINNLNQAIKFCKVLHSAEGTNLFCVSNSNKKLKKLVSADV